MRILVFGDSITYGKVDRQGGWVTRLRNAYDESLEEGTEREYPNIYNLGISGDTAEGILKRFDVEAKAREEDIGAIIFAIGTNDSVLDEGKPRYAEDNFQSNLEQIINKAKKFTDKILIVGLLPVNERLTTPIPWRPKRHYVNYRIEIFDEILKSVSEGQKTDYLPLKNDFIERLDLFPDGLHPNDEGHKLIFELIRPKLDRFLNT